MNVLQNLRPSFSFIQLIVLAVGITGAASQAVGQAGTSETVIQKAEEQFENSPLKTTSLGRDLYVFAGDGGNVTAIVDDGSTLLVDSGVASRTVELNDAAFKMSMRPVTRLVNTHWHFDHTGGNVFFGSSGVTIIAQQNVKKQLSSVQDVPFVGLRDGHYPEQALPTVTYSSSMVLRQGSQRLTLANYGPAHTDGDTIIYITPANVVVVGDIFSNAFYPHRSDIRRIDRRHDSFGRSHSGANRRADKGRPRPWASSHASRSTSLSRHASAGSAAHPKVDRGGKDDGRSSGRRADQRLRCQMGQWLRKSRCLY